jgi:hypothetical protein
LDIGHFGGNLKGVITPWATLSYDIGVDFGIDENVGFVLRFTASQFYHDTFGNNSGFFRMGGSIGLFFKGSVNLSTLFQ